MAVFEAHSRTGTTGGALCAVTDWIIAATLR
jgi:hypothetical protein